MIHIKVYSCCIHTFLYVHTPMSRHLWLPIQACDEAFNGTSVTYVHLAVLCMAECINNHLHVCSSCLLIYVRSFELGVALFWLSQLYQIVLTAIRVKYYMCCNEVYKT